MMLLLSSIFTKYSNLQRYIFVITKFREIGYLKKEKAAGTAAPRNQHAVRLKRISNCNLAISKKRGKI